MIRPISATVRDGADAFIRLASLASSADGLQWERSHRLTPRDDVDRKAAGGHGDPTGETVLDPRRLALRDAVERSLVALEKATIAATEANRAITEALIEWHGDYEV